jgi:hypothetical protein
MRPRFSMLPTPCVWAVAFLLALPLLSSCATKKAWQPEGVTEVRVRTSNSEKCGVVKDPEAVREILDCLSRATPSADGQGLSRRWSHKVDIVGTSPECGRWLYAEKTGEYVQLGSYGVSVMNSSSADHTRLNELLPRKVEDPLAELRAGE